MYQICEKESFAIICNGIALLQFTSIWKLWTTSLFLLSGFSFNGNLSFVSKKTFHEYEGVSSLLAAPRVSSSNPAQGVFVGFILCLYKNNCVCRKIINKKIHPFWMAKFKKISCLATLKHINNSLKIQVGHQNASYYIISNAYFTVLSLNHLFLQAKSEKVPYPTWCLAIAFILAITSVIPIVVVAVLRITGLSKVDQSDQTAPMRRTDTNASTHPMMVGS